MTGNQIAYQAMLETRRANQAKEKETERHQQAMDTETQRHNLAQEQLGMLSFGETVRSNKAKEYLSAADLAEKNRANLINEAEKQRSNLAQEAELQRSHMAAEAINAFNAKASALLGAQSNAIQQQRADTADREAATHEKQATISQQDADTRLRAQEFNENVTKYQKQKEYYDTQADRWADIGKSISSGVGDFFSIFTGIFNKRGVITK